MCCLMSQMLFNIVSRTYFLCPVNDLSTNNVNQTNITQMIGALCYVEVRMPYDVNATRTAFQDPMLECR